MSNVRRVSCVALLGLLAGCGGDSKPLPPLSVGPEWMPLMIDTAGNLLMRRMASWADTMHVTATPEGHALVSQRMVMDMKIGGLSTTMHQQTEVDCAQRRYRSLALDSLKTSLNGVALPDSIAKKALADQRTKVTDTTWKSVSADAGTYGRMLAVTCGRLASISSPAAKLPAAKPPAITPPAVKAPAAKPSARK